MIASVTELHPQPSLRGDDATRLLQGNQVTNPRSTRPAAEALSQTEDGRLAQGAGGAIRAAKKGAIAGVEAGKQLTVGFGTLIKDYWQQIFSKDPNKQGLNNSKFLAISGLGIVCLLMTLKTIIESAENVMGSDKSKDRAPLPLLLIKLVLGAALAMTAHNTITRNGKPGTQNADSLVKWFIAFIGIDQITRLHSKAPNFLAKVLGFCGLEKSAFTEFMDNIGGRFLSNDTG